MAVVTKEIALAVKSFQAELDTRRPQLMKLAPVGFDPDQLIDRVKAQASIVLLKKPDLMECELASVILAVTHVVELGLDLSGPLPTAYIVPFSEKGVKKAQAMIAYTGLRELAVRSGCVKSIQAEVVHEHDKFEWAHTDAGLKFTHTHNWEGRGRIVGFYAHAMTPSGFPLGVRMSKAQVDAIRDASPAFKFGFSPWKIEPSGYIEMGKKTLIRRISKSLTLSPIMNRACEIMDANEGGLAENAEQVKTKLEVLQEKLKRMSSVPSRTIVDEPRGAVGESGTGSIPGAPSADSPPFDPAEVAAAMDAPKVKKSKPAFDLDGNPID